MIYFNVDDDTYIQYDEEAKTAEVIVKSEVQAQIDKLQENLQNIPDDDTLLAWAKDNYPGLKELNDTQNQVDNLQTQMSAMSNVKMAVI